MQKVICRVSLFREGVYKFVDEVNKYLREGYLIVDMNIEKKGLRFVCTAIVAEPEEQSYA